MLGRKKADSMGEWWGAMTMTDRLIVILTAGLIVAAFFLGYFYGQVTVLRGGGVLGAANAGANQAGTAPAAAPEAAAAAPTQGPVSDEVWNEVLADPAAEKGDPNAQIVMVEFTDYQCPYCKRHFDETDALIQANYVDTGKVKYVTRDLPLTFHPNAHPAAQAARCAGDQGKYWEMHDKLFEDQSTWTVGDPASAFSSYASELGLNVGTFDSCYSSGKYQQVVDDDAALAARVGATGTPTFLINGKFIVGAQPYASFEAMLNEAL